MIVIKTSEQLAKIRESGLVMKKVFQMLESLIRPGISTGLINSRVELLIRENGGTPTFKGYNGFPYALCISVNDVLIHGFPSITQILKKGDIVSCDVGVTLNGLITDACRTYAVGEISEEAKKLIKVTEESFFLSVGSIVPNVTRVGDISELVQKHVEANGFSVAKNYSGHGTGIHLHEDPEIPNYGRSGSGPLIKPNMVICVEPMVLMGRPETKILSDGWTVKSKDGKICAHYENTVIITDDGIEIVTL